MKKCFIRYFLTKTTLAALAAAVTLLASAPAHANTGWVSGGNWAATDGLVSNVVAYPDGLTAGMTTAQAAAVADIVANDYHDVGINFVRYPVNPATVSGNWAVTQAAINKLIADGLYVDICCWYVNPQPQGGNGLIRDMATWESMWQTVDGVYKNNSSVYYEPINEPSGYSLSGLEGVYTTFLGLGLVKGHSFMILDGTGYSDNVTGIGGDSALSGCTLSVHDYSGWASHTTDAAWSTDLYNRVYPYQARTIITEMGAPTTTGLNFLTASSGNNDVCFVRGLCNQCISWGGMGAVWFPAHQAGTGNNKRMFNNPGAGIINRSLVDEMQYGWGFFTTTEAPGCDINVIGTTDYAIYRTNSSGGTFLTYPGTGGIQYGANTDIAVPADYNGTGQAQLSVWRSNGGWWYIYPSLSPTQYGQAGDIPVPADYLGNGSAQMAVWRPSNGTWYVSGGGSQQWGTSGDIPVPGYYKGDGHVDYAVYRPSNNTWNIYGWSAITFGQAGDIPVPGDYAGNGTTQIAMFRPSNGNWYVYGVGTTNWGINGDVPVPGDYAGGGWTQLATWRTTNFVWSVDGGGTKTYGTTHDIPLPLPYAIRHACFGYNN